MLDIPSRRLGGPSSTCPRRTSGYLSSVTVKTEAASPRGPAGSGGDSDGGDSDGGDSGNVIASDASMATLHPSACYYLRS